MATIAPQCDNANATRVLMAKVVAILLVPAAAAAAALIPTLLPAMRSIDPLKYQTLLAAERGSSLKVVAVGDSHAAMGFRPTDEAMFSLAYPGETVSESAVKFDVLVEHFPRLRAVAVQAQPHMFFAHREASPRFQYLGLKSLLEKPLRTLLKDPCCRGSLPGMALRGALGLPMKEEVPMIEWSGFSFYPEHVHLDRTAQAHHELATYAGATPLPSLRREYIEFVNRIRKRQIDVVLTRYPLTKEYLSVVPKEVFRESDAFFSQLAREMNVKSCGSWIAIDNDSLFYNADHLNPEGAKAYWQMLRSCFATYLHND